MATRARLLAAQKEAFPESVIVPHSEVWKRWRPDLCHRTAQIVASTLLQHPNVLFYEVRGHWGIRYGTKGWEYVSFGNKC